MKEKFIKYKKIDKFTIQIIIWVLLPKIPNIHKQNEENNFFLCTYSFRHCNTCVSFGKKTIILMGTTFWVTLHSKIMYLHSYSNRKKGTTQETPQRINKYFVTYLSRYVFFQYEFFSINFILNSNCFSFRMDKVSKDELG